MSYIVGSDIAYDKQDDMLKVKSLQKKWRSDFSDPAYFDPKWEVVKADAGTSYVLSNSMLQITTGTTSGSEFILQSKETFSDPVRALFGLQLSQRIALQEFYVEFVSVDADGNPDGRNAAAWRIKYEDYTTSADRGVYEVQNGGQPRLASSVQALGVTVTSANQAILEIELFSDEAWFHSRTMDSSSGRSASFVRHQQIPDPNQQYKVRIRTKNVGVPASSTTMSIYFVTVVDYAELTAEITAGRGNTAAGQAMAVQVANTPSVIGRLDANIPFATAEYTTAQTANTTTAGTARDTGGSYQGYGKVRITIANTGDICHLILEQQENAGSVYKETNRVPVSGDGLYRTFEFPINLRYYKVRIAVGTSQTALICYSTMVHSDGGVDMDKILPFTLHTGAVTGSANSTQKTLNLGPNNMFGNLYSIVSYDQAGTFVVEQSKDGTNWRRTESIALNPAVAGTPEAKIFNSLIAAQYVRSYVINGATAQGAQFEHISSLVSN